MSEYEPVIGLEVHAELLTKSKMFCGCRVVDSVTAAPKAYQISQYELPLARDGWLDLELAEDDNRPAGAPGNKRIRIRRVHLEEDTGKLTHLEGHQGSLVDFNRSGVPLLEIVSEPDLNSIEEARRYTTKVRLACTCTRLMRASWERRPWSAISAPR